MSIKSAAPPPHGSNLINLASNRDKIVLTYTGLVTQIARRFAYNMNDLDDVIQVGTIGLLKSIDRFEPEKQVDFVTFATPNIIGEIRHYFRDKGRLLKIPRRLHEINSRARQFILTYIQSNSRQPTVSEIAVGLQLSEDAVLEGLEAGQLSTHMSLDALTDPENCPINMSKLLVCLGLNHEEIVLNRESIRFALDHLSSREQKMVYYRFYDGLTQGQIGDLLGISQTQVCRQLSSALKKLKKALTDK